jgi:RNase H-fold protein (predicted Holliday junction resolvase)
MTADFSAETLKAKRAWSEVFLLLNENNFSPILYPAKLSFNIDGSIKVFQDKLKLKQYMTTKPPLQKILQGILHTEDEANKSTRGQEVLNHRRRKNKYSESIIDSAAHNQILKQQKQLNGRIQQDSAHIYPY